MSVIQEVVNQCMRTYLILSISFLLTSVLCPPQALGQNNKDTKLDLVIIDPGHGGKDWGASSSSTREKDIVLAIGLKVGKMIEDTFPDIKVIYTRKTDVFIPLNERARIANKNKADLFISIHTNAVGVKNVSGAETFVLGNHRTEDNLEIAKKENSVILLEDDYNTTYEGFDPNSSESYIMFETIQGEYLEQSLQFASFIQNHFKIGASRTDRGVRQAGFLVLRETAMPSVLVETGFISNEKERLFLESAEGKEKISTAIFMAFSNYKNVVEQRNSLNNYKTVWPQDSFNANNTIAENKSVIVQDSGKKDSSEIIQATHSQAVKNITDTKAIPGDSLAIKDNTQLIPSSAAATQKPGSKEVPAEKKDTSIVPNNISSNLQNNNEEIWFSVQITISTKPVTLVAENFKGEQNITSQKIGTYFKYFSGKFQSYSMAVDEKNRLKSKFTDAFVVAFRGEQPIPVKEALEKQNK